MTIDCAEIGRRRLYMDNDMQKPNTPPSMGKRIFNILNMPIVSTIVGGLAVALIIAFFTSARTSISTIAGLPSRMDAVESRIGNIEHKLGIDNGSSQDKDMSNNDSREPFQGTASAQPLVHVFPTTQTESCIDGMKLSMSNVQYAAHNPTQVTNPVGYAEGTQEEYNIDQLAEQKLLLNYMDGEQQVFFYGQFDVEGYWNGNCIINAYENERLVLIIDANYDHGELLEFKQAFPYVTMAQNAVWLISDRAMETGFSSGETIYYYRDEDFLQNFSADMVTAEDIFSVLKFQSVVGKTMEGYYCGNISNGLFNDDTGNAYVVKYFRDGTVKTLYRGKIKNGNFNDDTGSAWMIGKDDIDQKEYAYYHDGPFVNGKTSKDPKFWTPRVSLEWIENFVNEFDFSCELRWEPR